MPVVTHLYVLICRIHLCEEDLLVVKYETEVPECCCCNMQIRTVKSEWQSRLLYFVASGGCSVEYAVNFVFVDPIRNSLITVAAHSSVCAF
jgi:hypothetical protein